MSVRFPVLGLFFTTLGELLVLPFHLVVFFFRRGAHLREIRALLAVGARR